jgi:hypothetical protein
MPIKADLKKNTIIHPCMRHFRLLQWHRWEPGNLAQHPLLSPRLGKFRVFPLRGKLSIAQVQMFLVAADLVDFLSSQLFHVHDRLMEGFRDFE